MEAEVVKHDDAGPRHGGAVHEGMRGRVAEVVQVEVGLDVLAGAEERQAPRDAGEAAAGSSTTSRTSKRRASPASCSAT